MPSSANEPVRDSDEGLVFRGEVPLVISRLEKLPGDYELAKSNRSNEVLLKTSLLVNESADLDEHHELAPFLMKQDIKINLILDLLTELIRTKESTPANVNILLTPDCLVLGSGQGGNPHEGWQYARIELYLIAELPKPIELYATVEATAENSRLVFLSMDPGVKGQLEKILFRYHRRKIAQQKCGY